jgi:microcystin degradation protein MlrC
VAAQVRNAGRLDGLLLALHGAMCAEGCDDAEGALLETIRALTGPELPIVLTLDLHANITERMGQHADAILGYRTYPHLDLYETGAAAAELLLHTLRGEIRPVTAIQKIPMIVPAENMQTTGGPMAEVFRAGDEFRREQAAVLRVSVFGVQPWLDIEEMGCATAVVADRERALAAACASRMAQKFWDLREAFDVELLEPGAAIRIALATEGGPVVLSESSDSSTAGSPGDSAEMLRALVEHAPNVPAVLWLRDAPAVAQAWDLRPGAQIRTTLGGRLDRVFRRPVPVEGVVRSLSDGCYTFKGGWNRGMRVGMGRTAVMDVGAITAVVSEEAASMIDPEIYRSQGIEPRDRKIVVVKSANAFRAEYGPFASKILMVDTPGVSSANLRSLPYRRVPRPIYPLDPVEFQAGTLPKASTH